MVLIHESSIEQPDQPGPDQQFVKTADAQLGVSFCDEPAAPPTACPEISGSMRDPAPPYTAALNGLRRSVAIMLDLPSDLPPDKFCRDALGAASWRDQQLLHELITECDPQGRWLGLRKDS